MKNLKLIAAIGKNGELGKNNGLIWNLKEDLQYFKKVTTGFNVIMGEKTFFSLPKKLPNRKHYILTKNTELIFDEDITVFNDFDELIKYIEKSDEEFFVIGGAQIYKLFVPYVDEMYLTEIDETCDDADVYFPKFDKNEWIKKEGKTSIENNIKYQFNKYIRK